MLLVLLLMVLQPKQIGVSLGKMFGDDFRGTWGQTAFHSAPILMSRRSSRMFTVADTATRRCCCCFTAVWSNKCVFPRPWSPTSYVSNSKGHIWPAESFMWPWELPRCICRPLEGAWCMIISKFPIFILEAPAVHSQSVLMAAYVPSQTKRISEHKGLR